MKKKLSSNSVWRSPNLLRPSSKVGKMEARKVPHLLMVGGRISY